jgi:small-conductance mechanosensitive channel|tara:strand:- start:1973 stop:2242 length:270 start_codon:yes stop_codon:yes gene_type:complete
MTEATKESYIDEAKRRIAHLSYKLEQAESRVRKLEHDNAELQRWANDVCMPKLQELSNELSSRYGQKKYRNRNWQGELGRAREEGSEVH